MGQYKVPQDVEAEDKILGPLTMRQFIYAVIGIAWALLSFALLRTLLPVMIVVGVPPALLFLLLAFYKRDGQNFEQLLVAMAGYFGQSRKRVWLKEPIVEAFQIVPPKVTTETTQRNPAEVRSQLERLASVIDTRGSVSPAAADDRIYMPAQPAKEPEPEQPDIYEAPAGSADPLAKLIAESVQNLKAEAIEQMRAEAKAETAAPAKPAAHAAKAKPATAPESASVMTPPPSDDIIRLATENDDLTVQAIAAQAGRQSATLSEGESVNLRDV